MRIVVSAKTYRLWAGLAGVWIFLFLALPMARAERPLLDLAGRVKEAVRQGRHALTVPPGEYRLHTGTRIEGLQDFTINADGVTVYFDGFKGAGLTITRCRQVTLRGLTIDYDPLPYTQGKIVGLSADGLTYNFVLDEGYPVPDTASLTRHVLPFDGNTRLWKREVGELVPKEIRLTGGGRGFFRFDRPGHGIENLGVGDLIVLDRRTGSAINLSFSERTRLEDVTIRSAPGAGVLARLCEGGNYFRYRVERGPRPAGATEDRLLSTNADAFNYGNSRQGATLEGCEFAFQGDDGVNFHGLMQPVFKVESPRVIWTVQKKDVVPLHRFIRAGDTIRLLDPTDYHIKGQAKIASIEAAGTEPIDSGRLNAYWPAARESRSEVPMQMERITLQTDLFQAQTDDFFDIPELGSPHYTIRDCYFHDNRSRGVLLQSPYGVVENNRFERIKGSAIWIGPGYGVYREGGWPSHIVVRNNTIRDVGFGAEMWSERNPAPGAIALTIQQNSIRRLSNFPSLITDITIEDNQIDGCPVDGIQITNADGVVLRGNKLSHVNQRNAPDAGRRYGLRVGRGIAIEHSKNIRRD